MSQSAKVNTIGLGDPSHALVEVFIDGIEGGQDDVEDAHFADRSMTNPWGQVNAHSGANRYSLPIEFHLGFGTAFKNVIDLGVFGVKVSLRIEFDVNGMDAEAVHLGLFQKPGEPIHMGIEQGRSA